MLPLVGGVVTLGSWALRGYRLAKASKAAKAGINAVRAGVNTVKQGGSKVSQTYNKGIEKGVEKAMGTSKTVVPAPANTVIKGRQYKFINQKTGEGVNRKTAERFVNVQKAKRDRVVGEVKSVVNTAAAGSTVYSAGSMALDAMKSGNPAEASKATNAASTAPRAGQADVRRVDNAIDAANAPKGAAKVIADAKKGGKQVKVVPRKRVMANVEDAPRTQAQPNRPPAELANSGGAAMPSSSPSAVQAGKAANDEPELTMGDMMKKFSVADAKKAGLEASNAEMKSSPVGFLGSFQRFAEGNIDQEGSAAYNKYGAGRGYAELLKKAKAAKAAKAGK